MHSHIGRIYLTFLRCAVPNVSSNGLPERMQSHIGCICLTFLHCVFSNVSSNGLPERMHSHIGCICSTFLHCVLSNESSNCFPERMHNHIGCICLIFLHCASLHACFAFHPLLVLNWWVDFLSWLFSFVWGRLKRESKKCTPLEDFPELLRQNANPNLICIIT